MSKKNNRFIILGGLITTYVLKNRPVNRAENQLRLYKNIGRGSWSRTDVIRATMVSSWPRDFPGLGMGAQRLAARIKAISNEKIIIKYFAAGEKVRAFDVFDEVAAGNSQMYHSADYYWRRKHPGWAYFTSVPFGLTYTEMNAWIRFGGGQELWDELAGSFGLKNFMAGNTGSQMGGWFNKEMNSVEDFRGLRMRAPGLAGNVLAKLGARRVNIPGGEVYAGLQAGVIDAAEWVGPYNDYSMKFYEVAKYYYYPGFHEPGAMLSLGCNDTWFQKLHKSDHFPLRLPLQWKMM